jgi:transposase
MMSVEERLARIESMLDTLTELQIRSWYSVEEFAQQVNRSPFTVREWCRLGRIQGRKKESGRGAHPSWAISHEELQRYQREGLRRIH